MKGYIGTTVAIIVFVADQVTKWLIVHWMELKSIGAIDVFPPYLNLRMAWNRGINFGLFSGRGERSALAPAWIADDPMRWVLIAIAVMISAWVVWWMRSEQAGPWARASAGLLVGGAIGNVVDRVLYGAVADFLNMSCCGIENPYVFNIADISIFVGAVGLILLTGKSKPRDADEKAS
ncbi:MAG: signal peptidase II [Pseudomonadota bacterium]